MDALDALEIARWQFGITTVYHFMMVPLTIGLGLVVAVIQTIWHRTGKPEYLRMTKFWGKLFLINFIMGVATGIVQEFQFGMAWSEYSRFVGDVFGAPLALEALLAFFVESTFLGLWIFGWNRLGRWAHLATIWVVTLTAYLSAYWILVSNGFLNHPVGHRTEDGELVLDDPVAVLTNPSALLAFGHVLAGALLTAGFFMAGVSAYHLFRRTAEGAFFGRSLRVGVFLAFPALMVTAVFGGLQFHALSTFQPMKSAVFGGKAAEIARVQADMAARYGPGDYVPSEAWTRGAGLVMLLCFALMMYLTFAGVILACFKKAVLRFRLWHLALMAAVPLPYLAMIGGWVFREAGRQPWVVYGLLRTEDAVSDLSPAAMRISLTVFTTLFVLLLVLNAWLLARHARRGPVDSGLGHDDRAVSGDPVAALPATRY